LKKRPKVDVSHFSLLDELRQRDKAVQPYEGGELLGTSQADWAVHNFEDRSSRDVITHDELFLGHFSNDPRARREEMPVDGDKVLGNFDERIKPLTEEQARHEGERCMSCGLCFECDSCVIYCPQDAVHRVKKNDRTVGRYVYTDYTRCVGCHICTDVCPTGYIKMGLGQ
jgi:Pyruvate/2-oxoacid:ferredoxin oxidoreductase delta subunit